MFKKRGKATSDLNRPRREGETIVDSQVTGARVWSTDIVKDAWGRYVHRGEALEQSPTERPFQYPVDDYVIKLPFGRGSRYIGCDYFVVRDGNTNEVIGVTYQCGVKGERATAAQIAAYTPSIAAQTFYILRSDIDNGYVVGTVVASDPNNKALTYSIPAITEDGPNTSILGINAVTGELYILFEGGIDAAFTPATATVRVTNEDGMIAEALMTVNFVVFHPSLYGEPGIYINADNASTITYNTGTGKVSAITDDSEAGVDLAQATTLKQPTYSSDSTLGANVLTFNTSNFTSTQATEINMSATGSSASDFTYLHNGVAPWSLVALIRPTTSQTVDIGTSGYLIATTAISVASEKGIFAGVIGSQKEAEMFAKTQTSATNVFTRLTTGDAVTLDTWHVLIMVHVPSATQSTVVGFIYVDGVLAAASGTKNAPAYSTLAPDSVLFIGTESDGLSRYVGKIAELSIIKADVRNSVAEITAQIQEKWGL